MNKQEILLKLQEFGSQAAVYVDELMSRHTSFKVGGPADLLVIPKTSQAVIDIVALAGEQQIPLTILGNCSNVLVKDKGIRGIVLKIGGGLNEIAINGVHVECGAGALLSSAAQAACAAGLAGLEFAAGIPGSVGGGIYMNAGAYEGELKDVVTHVLSVDGQGNLLTRQCGQLDFAYRHSIFANNGEVILSAGLELEHADKKQISEKMSDFAQRRRSKQPLELPSAGSTFKRPQGYFAGQLIQEAGLCGLMIGGAQVSEKHAGFIVNKDKATAEDILALIATVQERVEKAFNVRLQTEVRVIGE